MSNTVSIARPGIALGNYPERNDIELCKWDKAISLIKGRLNKHKYLGLKEGHLFVKQVEIESF